MERIFNCSFENCSYKSNRTSNIITHERTHTGEKPFKCKYPACSYDTAHYSNLKSHEKIHPHIITDTEAAKILLSFKSVNDEKVRNEKPDEEVYLNKKLRSFNLQWKDRYRFYHCF